MIPDDVFNSGLFSGFDIVVRGMASLVNSLAAVLTSGQLLETEDRVSNLNCMKIMLLLFCQLVEMVDQEQGSMVDAVTGMTGFIHGLSRGPHDIHAHVRSHVLQNWGKLCKDKCIPRARQHYVLELAAERLQDKSSNVRKAAVQLLTTLLESNPFAAKLD